MKGILFVLVLMAALGCASTDTQLAGQSTQTLKARHDQLLEYLGYYKSNAEVEVLKLCGNRVRRDPRN